MSFKNAGVAVGVTATTVYTCPASTEAVVHALFLANIDGANATTVTIEVYDSSATATRTLGKDLPLPAQNSLIFDKPINLEASDELRITAAHASRAEAFVSVLEQAV